MVWIFVDLICVEIEKLTSLFFLSLLFLSSLSLFSLLSSLSLSLTAYVVEEEEIIEVVDEEAEAAAVAAAAEAAAAEAEAAAAAAEAAAAEAEAGPEIAVAGKEGEENAEAEGKSEEPAAPADEAKKTTPGPKPPIMKKITKKSRKRKFRDLDMDVSFVYDFQPSAEVIMECEEVEAKMAQQDRLIKETEDARNDLET